MKPLLLSLLLALAGCVPACTSGSLGTRTPLQPGDAIIFKGTNGFERANQFRQSSMNDLRHAGSIVEINRPTTLVTE